MNRWRSWFSAQEPAQQVAPPAPTTLAQLLRRLHWTVLRPLATYLGGDERSLVRGPGMELAEVRQYQPGDDVRHIDWNITARTEQPYVREAYAERALDAWLVIDVSASVDWGTAQCLKRDRLLEFVAVAGQLLGRRGHRVGAVLFAGQPLQVIPPGSGRVHLERVLDRVRTTPPPPTQHGTHLGAALLHADALMRRRGVLLIVSDFLTQDDWQPVLRRVAQRHDVVAIGVGDPREHELPDVGMIVLEDPETGDQLLVNTGDRALRARFTEAAHQQAETLRTELTRCGAEHLALSTGEALLPALVRFLDARRQRRAVRGQRGAIVRAAP